MKLRIRARNMSLDRHPFIAIGFDRLSLRPGKKPSEVTRIEAPGGDPGQTIELEVDWPAPDYPPGHLAWKAPPQHSLVWELLEFSFEGRPMLASSGMFA